MRLVVKVGSGVVTREDGRLHLKSIANLVDQVGRLKELGHEVLLVSSGAVAAGRAVSGIATEDLRVLASLGQVKLVSMYDDFFANYGLSCSQLLLTKENFRSRAHYVYVAENFRSILSCQSIVPVINENDVLRSKDNQFTDNDELAGYVATAVGADLVVIMTSVKGFYNGDPASPSSKLIREITSEDALLRQFVQDSKTKAGRGGMATKLGIGLKLARLGIAMMIVDGKKDDVLLEIASGDNPGTRFIPRREISPMKKWLANSSEFAKGRIVINDGAVIALQDDGEARSLLPVGVVDVSGEFEKGEVVVILNENLEEIGVGKASYAKDLLLKSLGQQGKSPVVHYDNLFMY